jgi:hypothetical protein
MAKVKPYTRFEADFGAYFYHCGGTARGPGHPWHGIFPYLNSAHPLYVAYDINQFALTLEDATIAAHTLVALPLLVRDICFECWDDDFLHLFTGRTPRWNIYRGQTRELVIPCIYWDWFNADPPPGFQWDGS